MSNGRLLSTATASGDSDSSATAALELDAVSKWFGADCVIDGLSVTVREGEILTLLGPSGCGKTTTLRLISGLEKPDGGLIQLRGEPVAGNGTFVPPERRGIGVVFQQFALFPHLTVEENIAFGIEEWPPAERTERVDELLSLVGLESHRNHYPDELSGGQQQRVALARSLAPKPAILLLDEPFSNLDVDLRVEMREEVRRIIKTAGVTAVTVTHDQEEALSISDRVAVLHDGTIEQVDTPERIFQQPESRFVAGFLGHASFLPGTVRGDTVDTALGQVDREKVHGLTPEYDGSRVDILLRPDDVTAMRTEPERQNGIVVYRRYLGPTVLYRVELDTGETVECVHNHSDMIDLDERVAVRVTADHELTWFPTDHPDRDESAVVQ